MEYRRLGDSDLRASEISLRAPDVASAIVGASRPEQVETNASASRVKLGDATLRAIDEALGDVVER